MISTFIKHFLLNLKEIYEVSGQVFLLQIYPSFYCIHYRCEAHYHLGSSHPKAFALCLCPPHSSRFHKPSFSLFRSQFKCGLLREACPDCPTEQGPPHSTVTPAQSWSVLLTYSLTTVETVWIIYMVSVLCQPQLQHSFMRTSTYASDSLLRNTGNSVWHIRGAQVFTDWMNVQLQELTNWLYFILPKWRMKNSSKTKESNPSFKR